MNNFLEWFTGSQAQAGAIDIIAIKRSDGTLSCSPFHVKLGKIPKKGEKKVVKLKINGKDVDLAMRLGPAGEAFFVERTKGKVRPKNTTPFSPLSPISATSRTDAQNIPEVDIITHDNSEKLETVRQRSYSEGDKVALANEETITNELPLTTFEMKQNTSSNAFSKRDRSFSDLSNVSSMNNFLLKRETTFTNIALLNSRANVSTTSFEHKLPDAQASILNTADHVSSTTDNMNQEQTATRTLQQQHSLQQQQYKGLDEVDWTWSWGKIPKKHSHRHHSKETHHHHMEVADAKDSPSINITTNSNTSNLLHSSTSNNITLIKNSPRAEMRDVPIDDDHTTTNKSHLPFPSMTANTATTTIASREASRKLHSDRIVLSVVGNNQRDDEVIEQDNTIISDNNHNTSEGIGCNDNNNDPVTTMVLDIIADPKPPSTIHHSHSKNMLDTECREEGVVVADDDDNNETANSQAEEEDEDTNRMALLHDITEEYFIDHVKWLHSDYYHHNNDDANSIVSGSFNNNDDVKHYIHEHSSHFDQLLLAPSRHQFKALSLCGHILDQQQQQHVVAATTSPEPTPQDVESLKKVLFSYRVTQRDLEQSMTSHHHNNNSSSSSMLQDPHLVVILQDYLLSYEVANKVLSKQALLQNENNGQELKPHLKLTDKMIQEAIVEWRMEKIQQQKQYQQQSASTVETNEVDSSIDTITPFSSPNKVTIDTTLHDSNNSRSNLNLSTTRDEEESNNLFPLPSWVGKRISQWNNSNSNNSNNRNDNNVNEVDDCIGDNDDHSSIPSLIPTVISHIGSSNNNHHDYSSLHHYDNSSNNNNNSDFMHWSKEQMGWRESFTDLVHAYRIQKKGGGVSNHSFTNQTQYPDAAVTDNSNNINNIASSTNIIEKSLLFMKDDIVLSTQRDDLPRDSMSDGGYFLGGGHHISMSIDEHDDERTQTLHPYDAYNHDHDNNMHSSDKLKHSISKEKHVSTSELDAIADGKNNKVSTTTIASAAVDVMPVVESSTQPTAKILSLQSAMTNNNDDVAVAFASDMLTADELLQVDIHDIAGGGSGIDDIAMLSSNNNNSNINNNRVNEEGDTDHEHLSLQDIAFDDSSNNYNDGDSYFSDTDSYLSLSMDEGDSMLSRTAHGKTPRGGGDISRSHSFDESSAAPSSLLNNNTSKKKYLYRKVLIPSQDQLSKLPLQEGENEIVFELEGCIPLKAQLFVWNETCKIVVTDIEGVLLRPSTTIKSSGWGGLFSSNVPKLIAHEDTNKLFTSVHQQGYQILYITKSTSNTTTGAPYTYSKDYLSKITATITSTVATNTTVTVRTPTTTLASSTPAANTTITTISTIPNGPIFKSPESLVRAFGADRTEVFKAAALRGLKALFPNKTNPFHASFSAREGDINAFIRFGFPEGRIFVVNDKGMVKSAHRVQKVSIKELSTLKEEIFPYCCCHYNHCVVSTSSNTVKSVTTVNNALNTTATVTKTDKNMDTADNSSGNSNNKNEPTSSNINNSSIVTAPMHNATLSLPITLLPVTAVVPPRNDINNTTAAVVDDSYSDYNFWRIPIQPIDED